MDKKSLELLIEDVNTKMSKTEGDMDLERQIKYLEEEIRVAELYPTDTAQFYAALERSKQKLRELNAKLDQ